MAMIPCTCSKIDQLKLLFNIFDQDGSGNVDEQEFRAALRMLGCDDHHEHLVAIQAENDKDGDGEISFCEFVCLLTLPSTAAASADVLKLLQIFEEAFDMIKRSKENQGFSVDDAQEFLSRFGFKGILGREQLQLLVDAKDGDGEMDFIEFSALLSSTDGDPTAPQTIFKDVSS